MISQNRLLNCYVLVLAKYTYQFIYRYTSVYLVTCQQMKTGQNFERLKCFTISILYTLTHFELIVEGLHIFLQCMCVMHNLFQESRTCNKHSILFYTCFLQDLSLKLLARMFSSQTSKATKEAYSCLGMSVWISLQSYLCKYAKYIAKTIIIVSYPYPAIPYFLPYQGFFYH